MWDNDPVDKPNPGHRMQSQAERNENIRLVVLVFAIPFLCFFGSVATGSREAKGVGLFLLAVAVVSEIVGLIYVVILSRRRRSS